jgi:hypothetical protein
MSTRKRVTKNDILSFVYGETGENEKFDILQQMSEDLDLSDFFAESVQLMQDLDKIEYKPSESSVKNILNYSKSYAAKEHILVS